MGVFVLKNLVGIERFPSAILSPETFRGRSFGGTLGLCNLKIYGGQD